MPKTPKYARVIFDLPFERQFHYLIPEGLKGKAAVGKRVTAPFGKKILPGFIVGVDEKTVIPQKKIKTVLEVLDDEPLVNQEMLRLTRWLSGYYFCPWGKALFEAVPAAVKQGKPKGKEKKVFSSLIKAAKSKFIPTKEQSQALRLITNYLEKGASDVILLFGKEGSGKAEVYLQGIDFCLQMGKQAIILVPEISKAEPVIKRLSRQYGREVGILHSRLSRRKHYAEWQRIKKGGVKIVVGTRAAIFAPFKNLGLIVLTDEHDSSYKEEGVPRYHAREVAVERARLNKALVILTSATPSLETFYRAERKKIKMAVFSERVDRNFFPEVEIVDVSQEKFSRRILSPLLEEAIREKLRNKEQVILFFNRRGFATSLSCRQCGFVIRCPNCNLPLVFHQADKMARCHYCGHRQLVPSVCPRCFSSYIRYFGLGIEKVEEAVNKIFRGSRVIKIDSETLHRKKDYQNLLKSFRDGDGDFLIGTQVLTKIWDFPKVTLVGIISADVILNLPDFRSGERTFQLLSQLANQLAKGRNRTKMIIQTLHPDHSSLRAVKKDDFRSFYQEEIKFRRELNYPPFSHFANIILRGKDEAAVKKASQRLFSKLRGVKDQKGLEILGPVSPAYAKMKGKSRRLIILKAREVKKLQSFLTAGFKRFSPGSDINISVDVDPLRVL